MDNPGVYTLSVTPTAADTYITDAVDDLEGMLAAMLSFEFSYGSGGTTAKAYAQYSLDGGTTYRDAACAAFTTSSATKMFNISRLAEKVSSPPAPTDGALTDDTAVSGMLGPKWRLKVVTVGTYAGTTLVCRLHAA